MSEPSKPDPAPQAVVTPTKAERQAAINAYARQDRHGTRKRKRKKLEKLDYDSPEYWNRLLAQDNLSLQQGRHPKLTYVGGSNDVEFAQAAMVATYQGRVIRKDHHPQDQ